MSKEAPAQQIFPFIDKAQKVSDGFQNFALKLGVAAYGEEGSEGSADNTLSNGHYNFNLVTRNRLLLEAAYRGSWIVGRIVDSIAEDMTKAGIIITTNEGAEHIQDLEAMMSRMQIWQSLKDTIKWGRLYGGGVAVMQIEGQNIATPLDPATVGKDQFQGLAVYDRWQIWPVLEKLVKAGPYIGLPEYYDIVLGTNLNDPAQAPVGQQTFQENGRVRVHYSRCLRMGGIKLPFFQAITEMLWDESVLERLWDRLIEFDTATSAAGGLITRANLRTVGIDGLREILAAGGQAEEALISQFDYMRKFQSSEQLTLLDKNDMFASTAYSFSGLSDMLIQFGQQLSGSAEIPLVRLFGQSPAGLSATGESDIRGYYDVINAKQNAELRNPLHSLIKVMWQSLRGEPAPKDLTFDFTPLWQMSASDKATIAKTNTDAIIEAHEAGAISTQTMMKELKQMSGDVGLFTHISDEEIEEAQVEEPPNALATPGTGTGQLGEGPATPLERMKQSTGDSAWKKIQRFLGFKTKDYITKSGSKWIVHAESGKKLGEYGSKEEAEKRLRQIEYFKHKGDAMPKQDKVKQEVEKFEKGTLKSGSGVKVKSKKQALAIGYSEKRGGDSISKDQKMIRDYLKK